jgi:hypothetical protein
MSQDGNDFAHLNGRIRGTSFEPWQAKLIPALQCGFGGYENGFALTEPDPGTVHGKPGWWCRRCRSHKRVREVQLALVVEESADGLPRRSSEKQHRLSSRLIRQLVLSE